ncbi:MAG: inositol monophosphatase, partial [Deltaproteobacteria bacterium]|nr:inositol monophosphatase [Deltaproteobacteria bacterium]
MRSCSWGSLEKVRQQAVELAVETAAFVRRASCGEVRFKGRVELVTEVDTAAEQRIASGLQQRFPGCRLVLEEGGTHGDASLPTWHVDPLDGTTNFVHGFPQVAISLALEQHGELLVGVVADVYREEVYSACRGGGGWVADREGQVLPLAVSRITELSRALLATGFPYDRHTSPENNLAELGAFLRRAQCIRRAGSAALDLAFVARGWLDGYWEMKLQSYDVAAGALLVQEAGH